MPQLSPEILSATDLNLNQTAARLEGRHPEETLAWAFEQFGAGVTLATGFGAEGAVLIDIAARLNPAVHVFFVDTSFLFEETYELRERIETRYGIRVHAVSSDITPARQSQEFGAALWEVDPDLCCAIRKVEPLAAALEGRSAWITAIRRDQTPARASARVVEWDHRWGLVKINPLVAWSRDDVWEYIRRYDVPYNPLHDRGYPSIGCTHCTRAVRAGEHERSGRWAGAEKTECGLHVRIERRHKTHG